ncbi:pheromone processing endoprotease [Mortierella sp. AD031]|nr:pheromone processing endoprotease [Mortierella sp. AD031]
MGELLGLRFESVVGNLQEYLLYSAPKRVGEFSSKDISLSSSSRIDSEAGPKEDEKESDPIVERFCALKKEYIQNQERTTSSPLSTSSSSVLSGSSAPRRKRNDLQADIVRAVGTIERQELRQRVKKRAPLPGSDPNVSSLLLQHQQQGREREVVRRGGGDNSPERLVPEPTTELEIEDAAEDEEVSEDETGDGGKESEEAVEEEGGGGNDPKTEYQPAGEEQPEDGYAKKFDIADPGFRYQWHLHNTKDRHDINVTGVWEQGINGTGVNVAIIDDGLDSTSEDLAPNFFKEESWDFNNRTALPMPRLIDDQHGTRCAGEIAAAKNDLCGLGVAYGAKVTGLRILSGQITDVDEAAALNYRFQDNHIYSCSWGPPDDGQSMDAPKGVVLDAMKNGIKNGRSGLGSIFVFATGNGGSQDDDCSFDGYTNSLYTVSIGAIDRAGRHPYYSEACSAQLAVTYSNGGGSAIYTCDVGERRCFDQHGGTSAAAPIAAGMIALVLSVRPDLNWRDVQYLVMTTAVPVSVEDEDWEVNAAGRMFNHKFGYGSLDAYALVEAAKTFQSLGPQTSFYPPAITVGRKITQGAGAKRGGVTSSFMVTEEDLLAEGVRLGTLEHVTVTVNIEHGRRGDVEVILASPHNIESRLGARRRYDVATTGFPDWTFMTIKHWGENPLGEWKLTVRDQSNPNYTGKFVDWRIQFWGETKREIANIKAKPLTSPPSTGDEEEQLLNESPILVTQSGGDDAEPVEVTVDVDGDSEKEDGIKEEKEQEEEQEKQLFQSPGDKTAIESKVIVDKDPSVPKKLGKGKENPSSVDPAHESDPENFEPDSEEEVASTVSNTLYAFCGVLGVAGLIAGYLARHRWDGRGRYVSVRRDDGPFSGDGDIDLLPRILRSGGRSDLSFTEYEDGEGDSGDGSGDGEEEVRRLRRGLEMESRSYKPGQQRVRFEDEIGGAAAGEGEFEVGSDTDDDFLAQPGDRSLKKKKEGLGGSQFTTSSPATLLVEDA